MIGSSSSLTTPKIKQAYHEEPTNLITINEKVNLTKKQYDVLKIICDTYEQSISEYLEEALVEAMQYDIEEGNFSVVLLEKLTQDDEKDKENNPSSSSTSSMKSE